MCVKLRLKKLRVSKGITQQEMADFLGIVLRSYQRYENNEYECNFTTLLKLADYFDVSTDYLLGRTDNPKINR